MDEYGRMGPHRHHKRSRLKGRLVLAGVIIVVILVAGFAYYFLGGPVNVTGPTTLTVNSQGTVFAIAGKSYVASLAGYNSNTQTTYIYISSVPVLLGPILNVTLHQNSTVKVNYGGQYAIMQIAVLSASRNSAKIQVDPLPLSLQVSPDYQYIGHPSVQLPGLQASASTTTAPTTTVSSGGGSSTTAPTTTVQATNYTQSAMNIALKGDQNYALMLNLSDLYGQTPNCSSHTYNTTYTNKQGSAPVPPADYRNVSYETPYGMVQKTIAKGGTTYALEFKPLVHDLAFNGTIALEIDLTVTGAGSSSALAIVKSDSYGGIFGGLTYSDLSGTYTQFKAVNNACAAMVG